MTLRLSKLAGRIGHSGTMAADERMQRLRAAGKDIVSLGAGQLDFDTPAPIATAGRAAIDEGRTRYTPVAGTTAIRRAVRHKFERENGILYGDDQVIVGAGAKPVIFHALLALIDPGDVVLIPSPAWPSYASMVELAGGRVLPVPLDPASSYRLRAPDIAEAVKRADGKARGLIVNSPHNPTGAVTDAAELARIARVVAETGLWAVSDEIYEHLTYDGPFTSFAATPEARDRTLTVNGVSKAFAMTGWRIGYAGGPAPLIAAMEALQSHTSGNPSSIGQHAAEVALRLTADGDPTMLAERERFREALIERRNLVCGALESMPRVSLVRPAGAFYVFADVSSYYGGRIRGRPITGSNALADLLLEEAGVAVVPGAAFGDDRCIRLSFASSLPELETAMTRLRAVLD